MGGQKIQQVLPSVPRRWQYLAAGHSFPRHRHRVPHLSIVLSGEFDELGDDGSRKIEAGEVLIRPAFSSHSQLIRKPTRIYNIGLPMDFTTSRRHGKIADPDFMIRCFERDPIAALETMVQELRPVDRGRTAWPDRLAMAIERSGSLKDFAHSNGLHAAGLSRRFARLYGITPAHFRRESRARVAIERIFALDEPFSEIAYDLGFADQAHMCREVRALSGLSPGQWRRLKKFNTATRRSCELPEMNRREFSAGAAALGAGCIVSGCTPLHGRSGRNTASSSAGTAWSVVESPGTELEFAL